MFLNSLLKKQVSTTKGFLVEPFIPFCVKSKSYFYPVFNTRHLVKLLKTLKRFRDVRDFWPKTDSFSPILGIIKLFLKIKNDHFYPLYHAFHQVQFQKNLMNILKENFTNVVDFGSKKCLIYPIWGKIRISFKNPKQSFLPNF